MEPGGCVICGNRMRNRAHRVREMMFGLRDEFTYLECGACGGLQIESPPPDLARFYPDQYHSLREEAPPRDGAVTAWLKRQRARHLLHGFNPVGALVARRFGVPEYYPWLRRAGVRLEHEILDVGAGTGRVLLALRREGFLHLTGLEPHIPHDLRYENGVRVLRRTLPELDGPFDFIFFHHSFEHMPEPANVLREAHRLLRPERYVFIRIPVAGCFAWREYGAHWVNLDPPRHLWLPTVKGMELLAERTGFRLAHVEFDSNEFQFWASELYARDLPMREFEHHVPPESRLVELRKRTAELNANQDGDQACFWLQRA